MQIRKFKKGDSCYFIKGNRAFLFSEKITQQGEHKQELIINKMIVKCLKKSGNYEMIGGEEFPAERLLNYQELLIQIERLK